MLSRTVAVVSAALASLTLASPLAERATGVNCLPVGIEASCYYLVSTCVGGARVPSKNQLWHNKACVAAATCYGVGKLEDAVSCQIGASVTNAEQLSLDYDFIYSAIVGSCAYDSGGCPITQQNYIDYYYGTIALSGDGTYPTSSNIVISYWQAVEAWTATGYTVPYLNFNDWLHYSTYNTNVPPPTTTTFSSSTSTPTTISTPSSTAPVSSPVPLSVATSSAPTATP